MQADKTRVDYLRERKEAIYENLRDLNFEFQAGKYPEADYNEQRKALEDEAAQVIAEMEALIARGMKSTRAIAQIEMYARYVYTFLYQVQAGTAILTNPKSSNRETVRPSACPKSSA